MNKVFLVSALTLAVLTGCNSLSSTQSTPAVAQVAPAPLTVIKSPNDQRQYQILKLDNGIEAILISDPSAAKAAAALSVGVGLLHDPMSQQGMAHYLEHMLFLGTERYPDTKGYSDFMTQNGGAHNAYTWLDITNYMFKVNSNAYDEALDRFADFFKAPKLYPEYTEKEKNAVNAEWSMRRELDFFGQYKLARLMMGEHPANRFLIGNLETLGDKADSNLHAETEAFYQRYYSSNIMKVTMLSPLPLTEMAQLATKHFASIKNKQLTKPTVTADVKLADVAGKRVHYVPNEDVKQLKLDFTIRNNTAAFSKKPNEFIAYLLGSEMPGTPAQVLKQQGWVSSLSADASPDLYGNFGSFSINVELTDAGMQHREQIVATLMQYLNLIKSHGADSKYFQEIRTSLNNRFQFLQKGDEFDYVAQLTDAMQKYPVQNVINANFEFTEFSPEAINDVLAQLSPSTLRVWYISKQEPHDKQLHFYDGRYQITDISAQEQASWQQPSQFALTLPAVNTLLPEQFAIKRPSQAFATPQVVVEQNNIKAWLYPSRDFADQPKGNVKIVLNNPATEHTARAKVLGALWQDLYNLEQSALATEASIAGMSLSFSAKQGLELNVGGFTDKQATLVSKALASLQVRSDEATFEQAKQRLIRDINNQKMQFPYSQAFAAYGQITRSGNYDDNEMVAIASKVKLSDLNAYISEVLHNHNARVFAFGNYNEQDVQAVVSQIAKQLPENRNLTDYVKTKIWQAKPGEVRVLQQDIPVADVAMIDLYVHPQKGLTQQAQGYVLQDHFSTYVFDKLRTEQQLAYAVGAFSPKLDEQAALGLYIQSPVAGPKQLQSHFDEVKQQYSKVLMAMTEQEFAKLKASALAELNEPAKNLSEELAPLNQDWVQEKFDFASKAKFIAAVEQVRLADIQQFYQQTMMSKNAARLSIQLRGSKFKDAEFANIAKQQKITSIARFQQQAKML